jgi:hypothetical protein
MEIRIEKQINSHFKRLLINLLDNILRIWLRNAGMWGLESGRMMLLCFRARKWICAIARSITDES